MVPACKLVNALEKYVTPSHRVDNTRTNGPASLPRRPGEEAMPKRQPRVFGRMSDGGAVRREELAACGGSQMNWPTANAEEASPRYARTRSHSLTPAHAARRPCVSVVRSPVDFGRATAKTAYQTHLQVLSRSNPFKCPRNGAAQVAPAGPWLHVLLKRPRTPLSALALAKCRRDRLAKRWLQRVDLRHFANRNDGAGRPYRHAQLHRQR